MFALAARPQQLWKCHRASTVAKLFRLALAGVHTELTLRPYIAHSTMRPAARATVRERRYTSILLDVH
jgi:hypothetical protein